MRASASAQFSQFWADRPELEALPTSQQSTTNPEVPDTHPRQFLFAVEHMLDGCCSAATLVEHGILLGPSTSSFLRAGRNLNYLSVRIRHTTPLQTPLR